MEAETSETRRLFVEWLIQHSRHDTLLPCSLPSPSSHQPPLPPSHLTLTLSSKHRTSPLLTLVLTACRRKEVPTTPKKYCGVLSVLPIHPSLLQPPAPPVAFLHPPSRHRCQEPTEPAPAHASLPQPTPTSDSTLLKHFIPKGSRLSYTSFFTPSIPGQIFITSFWCE